MQKSINRFDRVYTKKIQSWRLDRLPAVITYAGGLVVISSIAIVAIYLSLKHNDIPAAIAFIWAITACLVNSVLKIFLRRRRPISVAPNAKVYRTYSFPSGHAFCSTVTYGLIAFYCLRVLSAPLSILAAVLLAGLAVLIGLSRVYLGAHYPTDVIGGFILGSLALAIIVISLPAA